MGELKWNIEGGVGPATKVFLNYRREDAAESAMHLGAFLEENLGAGRTFFDRNHLEPSQDWPDELRRAIQQSAVVFVLIGSRWLELQNAESKQRRIDEPGDWVRQEIELALNHPSARVVPLFLGIQVRMPKRDFLPPSIHALAGKQGYTLRIETMSHWKIDLKELLVKLGLKQADPDSGPQTKAQSSPARSLTFRVNAGTVTCTAGSEQASGPLVLDPAPDTQIGRDLEAIESNRCKSEDIRNLGSELWLQLRPGLVEPLVSRVMADAERTGGVTEIRLCMPPQLEQLPWEALDTVDGECFSIDQRYSVSRLPFKTRTRPRIRGELRGGKARILLIVPGGSGLQSSIEVQKIREITMALPVHLELVTGHIKPNDLADKLDEKWDVVHFIGHGRVENKELQLRLSDGYESASTAWVEATSFVKDVAGAEPQIVLLNCCHSAGTNGFGGSIGNALLNQGVPAAVVMQYEIRDAAAAEFSRAFYRELLTGSVPGDVGRAVQEGRLALRRNFPDRERIRSHITPVLYLAEGCRQVLPTLPITPPSPPEPSSSKQLAESALPDNLLQAIRKGCYLPILGPGILTADAVRRDVQALDPAALGSRVAEESQFPDLEQLHTLVETSAPWLVPILLPRYCQHYENVKEGAPVEVVQHAYQLAPIPPCVALIASWQVPGFVYTHLDGLLEREVSSRPDSKLRILQPKDFFGGAKPMPKTTSFVNLRGNFADPDSMILTEFDEDVVVDRAQEIADFIKDLCRSKGAVSLVFIGVSPRDPIVRSWARRILERKTQRSRGPVYFAAPTVSEADRGYWDQMQTIHWLEMPTDTVVRAITNAIPATPGGRS